MKLIRIIFFIAFVPLIITSCVTTEINNIYTAMEKDLAAIKTDFNAAADRVRLVFILSPT